MSVAAGSISRLGASRRFSGGSGRFRLEPAAGAARLMSVAAGSISRLSASRRFSGGSGRFRLEPAARAARLMEGRRFDEPVQRQRPVIGRFG
jgi:hypothetical protein